MCNTHTRVIFTQSIGSSIGVLHAKRYSPAGGSSPDWVNMTRVHALFLNHVPFWGDTRCQHCRYDHDLIRTDSRAQTLDAFISVEAGGKGSSVKRRKTIAELDKPIVPVKEPEEDDWDPIRQKKRKKPKSVAGN